MEKDAKVRRARYIDRSVEIREKLKFAGPEIVMKAHDIKCCDAYGAMLWNLRGEGAESFFKAWNTAVKLTHGVPRNTFTYLVEGFLAGDHSTLRNQVLGRYKGFLKSLQQSPSPEVRILVRVVTRDARSNTSSNIHYLEERTGLNLMQCSNRELRATLPVLEVPETEQWRLGLLSVLFKQRDKEYRNQQKQDTTNDMINSLCNT